jgi:streptogramin lyase
MKPTRKVLLFASLVGSFLTFSAATGAQSSLNSPVFSGPSGIVVTSTHVWVSNTTNNTVTELDARTGAVVQVIGRSTQDFGTPASIAVANGVVWVANVEGNAATELNESSGSLVKKDPFIGDLAPGAIATGDGGVWFANELHESFGDGDVVPYSNSLVELSDVTGATLRTIEGSPTNGLDSVASIAVCGGDLWAANFNSNSVSEFNALTGGPVRVITGDGIDDPTAVACDQGQLWVTNLDADRIVVLRSSDGSLLRTIQSEYVAGSSDVAFDAAHAWVVNPFENSLAEFEVKTGELLRLLHTKVDDFNAPTGVAVGSGHVWVTNQYGNNVTELDEKTGHALRVIPLDAVGTGTSGG